MKPKISIIVPFYNTGKYIRDTLNDILNQTYRDYECILVDNASVDDSRSICEATVEGDSRFKVVEEHRLGPSFARNAGLGAASGEYVYFCDSDDRLHPQLLESCLHSIQDADMLQFAFDRFEDGDDVLFEKITVSASPVLMPSALDWFIVNNPKCSLAIKFFKRRIISGLKFRTQLRRGEDRFFVYELLLRERHIKLKVLDSVLYYYRRRTNSITTSPYSKEDVLQVEWLVREQAKMFSRDPSLLKSLRERQFVFHIKCVYRSVINASPDVRDMAWRMIDSLIKDSVVRYRDFSLRWALRLFVSVRRLRLSRRRESQRDVCGKEG